MNFENYSCNKIFFFPKDYSDCSKYHVCNGTAHTIEECPASHQFTYDRSIEDPYTNPGNGEFRCRFRKDQDNCNCEKFSCSGRPNTFTFRPSDYFYYAYCLEIGTLRKTVMFKCPTGTRHDGYYNAGETVTCIPISKPLV